MTNDEREARAERAVALTATAAEFMAGLNTTSSGLAMEDIPEITRRAALRMLEHLEGITGQDYANAGEVFQRAVDEIDTPPPTPEPL